MVEPDDDVDDAYASAIINQSIIEADNSKRATERASESAAESVVYC